MFYDETIHFLSILTLSRDEIRAEARRCLDGLDDEQWATLSETAAAHRVMLRAFTASGDEWVARTASSLEAEWSGVQHAADKLFEVCEALEAACCPVVVIKSLDHWPDMGADLDVLTCSPEDRVTAVMRELFGASVEMAAWSDRVSRKLNFRLPDVHRLVQIHFGRLGQAGEQVKLAGRILERRVAREVGGKRYFVPAPEERLLVTTLERLYRHFYIRVCDFVDTAELLDSGAVDFDALRSAAKKAGIWPGVATFLKLVSEYASHYRGEPVLLPRRVELAARFGLEKIYPNAGFLRLPLFPQGAELFLRQMVKTLRRRDAAGCARLGLLPPLAAAAGLRYKITGNEHGIW